MSELTEKIPLFILDSNESASLFITHYTKWVVKLSSFPSFKWDLFIVYLPKAENLILVYGFLYHFTNIIDWKNDFFTYGSSGVIPPTSNEFATAFNLVFLVGELNTPSLCSSVYNTPIIPSHSVLSSRDGFFKVVRYLGEDVSISSLHLYQGVMELPPCSFHASLEEQWDAEEEPEKIETVFNVVPPAYQKYLDVFFKVKEEKHPPHCTCDHHIEPEGSLPPVVVIYLL
ncbi:hypothetical protein O181_020073 [Austropuccinia psidii MF-1]|uniref:Uncharacterized protein n=1 Tax=Austropuccinia psidii MF-1 TaxID=1389203 RepID=A0A9Q3CC87_9BASI|nr:hypothetical protein [Austropuccinia psidii MF-1]